MATLSPMQDEASGRSYESATGETIYDEGLVKVACDCQGKRKVLRMRRTKVKRGLLAVRDLLETGHRVVFELDDDGNDKSRVEHRESGDCLHFQYKRRVWELEIDVLPPSEAERLMPLNSVHTGQQGHLLRPLTDGHEDVEMAVGDEHVVMDDTIGVSVHGENVVADGTIDDAHHEASTMRIRRSPMEPTRKEREVHEANAHIPYRAWCQSCIAGRGRADAHDRPKTRATSTVGLDYAYLEPKLEAEAAGDSAAPIIVVRDDLTGATFSEVLPSKGVAHPYNAGAVVHMLSQLPHSQISLKSDDEESIKALKRVVASELRVKHGKEVMELIAPDSASNGLAEGAARDVKTVTWTLLHSVSLMHGAEKIPARHAIVPWAVKHSGTAMTLAQTGPDGRTAYERMWGRKSSRQMIPFSERVMYHMPGPSRAEPRWERGLYLGLAHKGLYYIGKVGSVTTSRSVRRLPPSEKGSIELLNQVQGTPWAPTPGEIHLPEALRIGPEVEASGASLPEDVGARKHRTYLRRGKELKDFGYTKNCPGCDAARLGQPARGHTEACRARIEAEMRGTTSGRERLTSTEDRKRLLGEDDADMGRSELEPERASGSGVNPAEATGSHGPDRMEFQEKRRQHESDEARVVTRRIEDDMDNRSVKRSAEELEREKARARLGVLLAKVGCGEGPHMPEMQYFTVPAVCYLRSEDLWHPMRQTRSTGDARESHGLYARREGRAMGGQVAISLERKDDGASYPVHLMGNKLDVAHLMGEGFHVVEPHYPDGEEDGIALVTNMGVNSMEGQEGHLGIIGIADPEPVKKVYLALESVVKLQLPPKTSRPKLKQSNLRSQLYGAYAKQGAGITDATWREQEFVKLVHHMIKVSNAELKSYTSFVLNCMHDGDVVVVHRDKTNLPGTCVWTTSFGDFCDKGGRLWQFDTQGNVPPPSGALDKLPTQAKGTMTSTYHRWIRLHGEGWHAVESPKNGIRWSLTSLAA
eukprot:1623115-Amphidinium_carterae.3